MLVTLDVPDDLANEFFTITPKESHRDFQAFLDFTKTIDPKRLEEISILSFDPLPSSGNIATSDMVNKIHDEENI